MSGLNKYTGQPERKVTIDASATISRVSKKYRITPFPSRQGSISSHNNDSNSNNVGEYTPCSHNHDQYTGGLYSPYPRFPRYFTKSKDQVSQSQIQLLRLHKEFGGEDVIDEERESGSETELHDLNDVVSDEEYPVSNSLIDDFKNVYLDKRYLQLHREDSERNSWCLVSDTESYSSATSHFPYSEETEYESDCNSYWDNDDDDDDEFHDSVDDISKEKKKQPLYSLGDNANFSNFDNIVANAESISKKSHVEALYFVRMDLARLCPDLEYKVVYDLFENITPITHLKYVRTLSYPLLPENFNEDRHAQVYFVERLYAYHFELQQLQQYKAVRAQATRPTAEPSDSDLEMGQVGQKREQRIYHDYSDSDSFDEFA